VSLGLSDSICLACKDFCNSSISTCFAEGMLGNTHVLL
jgi:hypothetical protein